MAQICEELLEWIKEESVRFRIMTPYNLLHEDCEGTQLKKWQKILIRNSRHVTYL